MADHEMDIKGFEEDDNDTEELIDFNLVEAAEEIFFATAGDPLLDLTPIVYTTKLDDMQTVKQDVTGLDASEILKKLHSESHPEINYNSVKKRKMDSRCPSFMRVSRVVSVINSKASTRRKITEKPDRSYHNSQQHERCKPCTVVIKNIGCLVKNQQTIKLPISEIAIPKILQKPTVEIEERTPENNNSSNDNIKQTALKEEIDIEISVPNKSENGVEIAEDPLKVEHIEIDVELPEKNKNVVIKTENVEGSGRKRGRPKKRLRYICEDSDDDDIPLQAVKKAKLPSSRSSTPTPTVVGTNIDRATAHSQHVSRIVTDMVFTPLEKYFLIVLINKNNESTIYRTNATKCITDYYMTRKNKTDMTNNEWVLASLFPREEKIIEKYCCWYRREDIVSKICFRKNFPFIIQKFLKQPHGCNIEDCECCCRIELQKDKTKSNQSWREVVENNLEDTDAWIKQLLRINATNSDCLLSKTYNYIPKSQKLVDKNTRETQLNNVLFCIENCNKIEDNLSQFELYYIENNGDVQRTLFSNDREQVQLYKKSYQPISESKVEIKNALICCWYKREKLMRDLKKLRASPAALRHIQKPHRCARNNCSCCCKPTPLKLIGGNIVPPTLHHTALYENSDKIVEINFNKTKSQHSRIKNDARSQLPSKATKAKGTNATKAKGTNATNLSLSIDILDKFHTLKLGVSQYGTLEVILDAPSKTLSVQDLKLLSNTITLATNKMSELKLTAKEFCTRVNSKSTEPVQIKDFEATVLRLVESAPTEDTADNSDHYDNSDHMDYDDTDLVNTNVKVVAKPIASHSTITNKDPSTSSAPKVTHVSIPILQKPTNPKAGLLSALSGLMQTKSKCYVDSFKSFFKNSKETPVSSKNSSLQGTRDSKKEKNNLISLPVIADTFTLKHSSETTELKNTQMNGLGNSVDSTVKLRVKPVSELIADAPATDIGNVKGSSSDWAVPIMPNVEPPIAAQKITSNMAATVGPDMQNPTIPTFLIPQNVPIGTTFKLLRKPLSYTPNDGTTTTSFNKNGAHVLTLIPIKGQPSNKIVPELVPFRPQAPAPKRVYINKMTSLNTRKE